MTGGSASGSPRLPRLGLLGSGGLGLGPAIQEGIALEFGFYVGDKVKIGQLQQLDGLHQLRGHHQRLALPKLQSLRKRHGW